MAALTVAEIISTMRTEIGPYPVIALEDVLAYGVTLAARPVAETLLDAVIVSGAGAPVDASATVPSRHAWTIQVTGALSALRVDLEGSMVNVDETFEALDSFEGVVSTTRFISEKPVNFVRANVVTLTADSGTPEITVVYAGKS